MQNQWLEHYIHLIDDATVDDGYEEPPHNLTHSLATKNDCLFIP